ncbi:hypothetical protein Srufu_061870 [Streptomyces libani subsp. rufus]|nr:hypothetical protein Srufu_061870 [Streptomyces libani subsp. rufus]
MTGLMSSVHYKTAREGWLLGFPAWLFAVVMTPVWLLVLWLPVSLVGIRYAQLAAAAVASMWGARRVLGLYPWQVGIAEVRSKKNGSTQFVVPDPSGPTGP